MRAIFSENPHRNHRHTGAHRAGVLGPRRSAARTRIARASSHADAAILLKQSEISGELLARRIRESIENPQRLQQMATNCARMAPKDAAGRVASTMEKYTSHECPV